MKNLIISIISILLGLGLILSSFFYLIPKLKKSPNRYTNGLDKLGLWITNNWIWCLVILLTICLIFIIVYIALSQKGKI